MSEVTSMWPESWHIRSRHIRRLFDFSTAKGAETPGIANNSRAALDLLGRPELCPPLRDPLAVNSFEHVNKAPLNQSAGCGSASHTSLDDTCISGTSGVHKSDLDLAEVNKLEGPEKSVTISLGPTALATVYNIEKNIFIAKRGRVQVPQDALERFDKDVKQRLINDLREVREQFNLTTGSIFALRRGVVDDSVYEPVEIRMSGRATGGENGHVTLLPTIWVRCPANCRRRMKRALRDPGLAWTKGTGFGKIMVADSASLLAAKGTSSGTASSDKHFYGLALAGGVILHLHISIMSTSRSANGLICQSTLRKGGDVEENHLNYSRLGGILFIDGRPVGITSAHRILNGAWDSVIQAKGLLPEAMSEGPKTNEPDPDWTDPDSVAELSTIGSRPSADYHCYDAYRLRPPSPVTMSVSSNEMVAADLGEVLNLAGIKVSPVRTGGASYCSVVVDSSVASDFALVDLGERGNTLVNEYQDESGFCTQIRNVIPKANLAPGPVKILLNPTVDAVLLPDSTSLEIGGTSVPTKLLQLEKPLGKWWFHHLFP